MIFGIPNEGSGICLKKKKKPNSNQQKIRSEVKFVKWIFET
jgi:hypothetical protein